MRDFSVPWMKSHGEVLTSFIFSGSFITFVIRSLIYWANHKVKMKANR